MHVQMCQLTEITVMLCLRQSGEHNEMFCKSLRKENLEDNLHKARSICDIMDLKNSTSCVPTVSCLFKSFYTTSQVS